MNLRQIRSAAVPLVLVLTAAATCAGEPEAAPPTELKQWLGPQEWKRETKGPVLSLGPAGAFDDRHMFAPCVARENGRFLMWYCGSRGTVRERVFRLGLASSVDGVHFEKYRSNPVFGLDGGTSVLTPTVLRAADGTVLREDGRLRMWFSATRFTDKSGKHTLHEATSEDGIRWSNASPAQLEGVYAPSILKEGGAYRLWYTDVSRDPWLIRHATSEDGRRWNVDKSPVLHLGQTWERGRLFYPTVVRSDGVYLMWYGSYWSKQANKTAIGFAASTDGKTWHKHPRNPVLRPDPARPWESHYTTSQSVMRLPDGSWRMWYASRKQPPFENKYFAIGTARWEGPPAKRRTIFNDDAQVLGEVPETGASAFVKAWLDREARFVPFTTYVFLAATPDICTYETEVGEPYGARFGKDFERGWAPGMRGLKAEGTDALELVTRHMQAKGIEVLAEIRMSDTHHRALDAKDPLCPRFALERPEYVIRQPDARTNETALDYSHPEVRRHRFAIMREIAEDYSVDGLELNFVRWAKHFPRDQGREKAPLLTEYLGEIRRMLDRAAQKRGRGRLTLGVRVPESVETCWLAGVDIKTWVEKGWLDYVVISTWNNTDPQVPVAEFTKFTRPAGVQMLVAMGNMIGAVWSGPPAIRGRGVAMSAKHKGGYQAMLITEAEARAAAANYYAWRADGISFWNVGIHFGSEKTAAPEQRQRIEAWTNAVRDPAKVYDGPRRYHYLPMGKGMGSRKPPVRNYPWAEEGKSPLGHTNSPVLRFSPKQTGKRLVFPFRMADGREGETLTGRLRFWVYHLDREDELTVDINGRVIDASQIRRAPAGEFRTGLPGERFEIDLKNCPPFRGDNQLGMTLQTKRKREQIPYMEELDILVESTMLSAESER